MVKKFLAYLMSVVGMLMILSLPVLLYLRLWVVEDDRLFPTGILNMIFGGFLYFCGMIWLDDIKKKERRATSYHR